MAENKDLKIFLLIAIISMLVGGFLSWTIKPDKYIPGKTTTETVTEYLIRPVKPDSAKGKGKVVFHKPVIDTSNNLTNNAILDSNGLMLLNVFNGDSVKPDSVPVSDLPYYVLSFPFETSRTDTLKSGDTATYGYRYPNNILWLNMSYKPDTTKIITKTITIEVEKPPGFFDIPAVKYTIYVLEAVGFFYLGTKVK